MALYKKYLFSDMDGTLLGRDKTIPEANRDAIQAYVAAGGGFAVATGRFPAIAEPYLAGIPVTMPSIVFNGAAVYDFTTRKYLNKWLIPADRMRAIALAALSAYPGICAEVIDERPIQLVNPDCTIMDAYILDEGQPAEQSSLDRCGDCMKLVFYGEHNALALAQEAILQQNTPGIVTFFSAPYYLEVLPATATKGDALRWICTNLGLDLEQTAAIGDYENDVRMLETASFSAAPSSAYKSVKLHADVIVADNDAGAVGDFISRYLLT